MLVVYQDSSSSISGGARSYRKWRHRKSRDWKRPWPEVTGSGHDRNRKSRKYVLRIRNRFPRFFLIVVVQKVPWLPEVSEGRPLGRVCTISSLVGPFDRKWRFETSSVVTTGHVTPKREGVPLEEMRACATGSCVISALVWPFHRKCRHQTSPGPFGVHLEWWGARNIRKLHNIRSNITRRASPGKYASAEVPLGCSLGRRRPIIVF
jgi:hypothetical protein